MCLHENVVFVGLFSLIGSYRCEVCKAEIDPVEYHRMKGIPHFDLAVEDYPEEHRAGITAYWEERNGNREKAFGRS